MGGLPLEIPWPPGPQAPRRRGGALSLGAAGGHGQRPDLGGAAGGAGARFTAGERSRPGGKVGETWKSLMMANDVEGKDGGFDDVE